jgi:membrane protein DedA with SNARE-associated domain
MWNGALIGLGWVLGAEWALVKQYAPVVEYAVLASVVGGICLFVWRRWRARK